MRRAAKSQRSRSGAVWKPIVIALTGLRIPGGDRLLRRGLRLARQTRGTRSGERAAISGRDRHGQDGCAARGGGADGRRAASQILFGDLHVHTTVSGDAFLLSLPMLGGEGAHPQGDACDYARFCSALDFWSITDHAESLTLRRWRETIESIRQCNAVASDARQSRRRGLPGLGVDPAGRHAGDSLRPQERDPRAHRRRADPGRPIGSRPRRRSRAGCRRSVSRSS